MTFFSIIVSDMYSLRVSALEIGVKINVSFRVEVQLKE